MKTAQLDGRFPEEVGKYHLYIGRIPAIFHNFIMSQDESVRGGEFLWCLYSLIFRDPWVLGPGSWVCVGSIGGTWGWLFIFVIVDVLMCTSLPG